jgi:hypothetical protein
VDVENTEDEVQLPDSDSESNESEDERDGYKTRSGRISKRPLKEEEQYPGLYYTDGKPSKGS